MPPDQLRAKNLLQHFSTSWPSSWPQGLGRCCARINWGEELRHIDRQGFCKPLDQVNRGVECAALDAADVGAIDCSIDSKALLRETALGPQPAKMPRHAGSPVHDRMGTSLPGLKPSNMFDIIPSRPTFWCTHGNQLTQRAPAIRPLSDFSARVADQNQGETR
ncbi:hypothetical protein J2X36_003967 [Methylobacterium sp. BE186]|nr:hypothetical protein [Methylobacterium sp. BE186]